MAQIVRRPRSDGGVTWQVKWRDGGTRHGDWQSESFTAEARARAFKLDVEESGHRWPEGWVKGEGYVTKASRTKVHTFAEVRDDYWRSQARRVRLGKLKAHSLARDRRTAELHLRDFATLPFADIGEGEVREWVDDQLESGAAPKSVRNRHGLLAAIFRHGIETLKLRSDNPTAGTDLPDVDSASARQIRFLQPHEWALLRSHLKPDVHLLVDVLLATGMRWGEVSALRVGDVQVQPGVTVVVHIQRAWSQRAQDDPAPVDTAAGETKAWKLGPPKTRKARFAVVTGPVAQALAASVHTRGADEYVFTSRRGLPWRYPDFHEMRWAPARAAAEREGLQKHVTIHMLRHSMVVWSLAGGVPIQVVSEALGHSSIQITYDVYGGLINLHDAQTARAMAAAMMSATAPSPSGG